MKDTVRFTLVLSVIAVVASGILEYVYRTTRPRREMWERKSVEESLGEVLEPVGARVFDPGEKDGKISYYKAYADDSRGQLAGYAFISEKKGYSSAIKTLVGIDTSCAITRIKVLSQQETPGLGARVLELPANVTLFEKLARKRRPAGDEALPGGSEKPWFQSQFDGKKAGEVRLASSAGNQGIQAITGATITSRAITDSVRERLEEVCNEIGATDALR